MATSPRCSKACAWPDTETRSVTGRAVGAARGRVGLCFLIRGRVTCVRSVCENPVSHSLMICALSCYARYVSIKRFY